jgi:polysaccharide deacetylase family protein (PEP-CTERM system associated)
VFNALTIDVEEWFHICGVPSLERGAWEALPSRVELTTRMVLDLCDRTDTRATFFVLGWIAERWPQLVADIEAAGHQIGSHGYAHARAYDLGEDGFRDDLRASIAALEAAGSRPTCFRAPEWSINGRSLWALDALAREGIAIDASMAPVRIVGDVRFPRTPHMRTTAAGPLAEVPPLVTDRFGQVMPIGWGWALRSSTPAAVLRTIEKANQAGAPAVLTVHPWEIDPNPPRVALPARLRFAHYYRLQGFADRLRQILESASFGSIDVSLSSSACLGSSAS